jgi:hypothetical protein
LELRPFTADPAAAFEPRPESSERRVTALLVAQPLRAGADFSR